MMETKFKKHISLDMLLFNSLIFHVMYLTVWKNSYAEHEETGFRRKMLDATSVFHCSIGSESKDLSYSSRSPT